MPRPVRARKPKTHFDGDDDEVDSPDARASPARRRAPPSALADAARTLEALQETNDWPSRALPRAAPPQPDAGAADASPPRARLPLRRTTAEERFAMLSFFLLHRMLACVQAAFPDAVDDDARFSCSVKWLAFGLVQPCSPPIPSRPQPQCAQTRIYYGQLRCAAQLVDPTSSGSLALLRSAAAPVLTYNVCVLGCRLLVPLLPSQVPSSDSGEARAKRKSAALTRSRPRTARARSSHAIVEFEEAA